MSLWDLLWLTANYSSLLVIYIDIYDVSIFGATGDQATQAMWEYDGQGLGVDDIVRGTY